jgi:hypothetical protein
VSSFANDFNRDYHVSSTKDEIPAGKVTYDYAETQFPAERSSRSQGVRQRCGWQQLPHLFHLRWPGFYDGLGSPPRSLRGRLLRRSHRDLFGG